MTHSELEHEGFPIITKYVSDTNNYWGWWTLAELGR